ncbi:MAG: LysR family transcriptional regulator [Verrucomicrobiota bacterium]
MEIYQVRSFLAVVEEESVTKAAKRLYTTPPSVSAHIKALEDELGIKLFERSTKGMKLTTEGSAIRDKADRLLSAALEISAQAASLRGQVLGGVEIGLNSPPSFLKATHLAAQLRKEHPGLELNFVSSDSQKIIDAIRTETLDAGFIYAPIELRDLTRIRLHRTELCVLVPIQWKDETPPNDWKALASKPWIYTHCYCAFHAQLEEQLKERNLTLATHVNCDSDDMRIELIRSGMGIGIMETFQADKLIKERKAIKWPSETRFYCDLDFAYQTRRAKEPAIAATVAAITQLWEVKR